MTLKYEILSQTEVNADHFNLPALEYSKNDNGEDVVTLGAWEYVFDIKVNNGSESEIFTIVFQSSDARHMKKETKRVQVSVLSMTKHFRNLEEFVNYNDSIIRELYEIAKEKAVARLDALIEESEKDEKL